MAHVLGLDGCRGGWCAVSIRDEDGRLTVSPPAICPSFEGMLETEAKVICVDIPIGLMDGPGDRLCDVEARRRFGKRAPVVFTPPCRSALSKKSHKASSEANHRVSGKGLSIQAFNIVPKIAEVDSLITPALHSRVHEVHPELCFWALNRRRPMSHKKSRLAGRAERWRLLRRVLPSLPERPPRPRDLPASCRVDDYVDALVAAWTAVCITRGAGDRIPHDPTLDDRGLRMEMWFPTV